MGDPSFDELLEAWIDLKGDLDALRAKFTLRTLRAFADDPAAQDALANWEALRRRASRLKALDHQDAAADTLRATLADLKDPVERRRAASALARLTHHLLTPTSPTRPATAEPDEPPAEPDPIQDHGRLMRRIAGAIVSAARNKDPEELLVLHRQLADDATSMGRTIDQDPDAFLESDAGDAFAKLRELVQFYQTCPKPDPDPPPSPNPEDPAAQPGPTPEHVRYLTAFRHAQNFTRSFLFHLTRQSPDSPWLITTITSYRPSD